MRFRAVCDHRLEDGVQPLLRDPGGLNRDSYNAIAEEWDASRTGFVLREQEYLDALLGRDVGRRVLDLGCGSGRPMAEYALERGHRVVGMDQSEELLKIASARYPEATWICGRIEDGAWVGSYDAVILWDTLFHIDRRHHGKILGWVAGCLGSGGRTMLTVGGSAQEPFTDTMFGREFCYDSLPPQEVLALLHELGLIPLIDEFMELPTGGRNNGRYAVVAERGSP
jgi:SAM-dependent methyltransferase